MNRIDTKTLTICIGVFMAFGTLLGIAMGNLAIGIGMAVPLAFGISLALQRRADDRTGDDLRRP